MSMTLKILMNLFNSNQKTAILKIRIHYFSKINLIPTFCYGVLKIFLLNLIKIPLKLVKKSI